MQIPSCRLIFPCSLFLMRGVFETKWIKSIKISLFANWKHHPVLKVSFEWNHFLHERRKRKNKNSDKNNKQRTHTRRSLFIWFNLAFYIHLHVMCCACPNLIEISVGFLFCSVYSIAAAATTTLSISLFKILLWLLTHQQFGTFPLNI